MSAADLISQVVNGAFVLIALLTLLDLARQPNRARLDIALLFGTLAFSILSGAVLRALGMQAAWLSTLNSILVVAQPFLLLRLVDHFRPVSGRVRWAAFAGFLVSSLVLVLSKPESTNPLILVIVAYFVLAEGYATFAFLTGARQSSGVIRWRMTFASAGSGWFALLILAAGVELILPAAAGLLTPLVQVLILLTVLSYYLAFVPPAALRRAWQLVELNRFLHELAGQPIAERLHNALDHLCPAATRAVGALGSAAFLRDETVGAFVLRAADQASLSAAGPGPGGGALERAWRDGRYVVAHDPAEFGPQLQPLAAALGAKSLSAVPIFDAARNWGVLVAFRARPSLFPGDDQEVLALLAGQAAQALENGELFAQQQGLVERLEAANKELEAFSYSVSHDLRAPLRAMDGFSRILLESEAQSLSPEGQHYLNRIRANAKRMGELVDDLLDFSRLGRQPLKRLQVDPAQVAGQAWDDLSGERAGRAVQFQLDAMPACLADPRLLLQVYANLLNNALKYSRKRESAHITVGCLDQAADPTYFVRDNGVGFDPAYAGKLFGVFQRLHPQEEYEGTGVGLAIVARIVQRHGGRVSAESKLGEGATFYFTLEGAGSNGRTDA